MLTGLNTETEEGCKSCFTEVKQSNFYDCIAGTLSKDQNLEDSFCGRGRG